MAKRPEPGRCVYCLEQSDDMTWDHVFPRAWYPDTTAPNTEKWKIPCCRSCNARLGKCEAELFIRFGLCIDPEDPDNTEIITRVLRALDPAMAAGEKDANARVSLRRQVLGELLNAAEIPEDALFPGFGLDPTINRAAQDAVLVSAACLHEFIEKIIRGIFFVTDARYVESPYKVKVFFPKDDGAALAQKVLDQWGEVYAREPGITVRRVVPPDDQRSGIFEIEIWKRLKAYGIVNKNRDQVASGR